MSSTRLKPTVEAEAPDSRWKGVYRAGGAAALVGAVFIPSRSLCLSCGRRPTPSSATSPPYITTDFLKQIPAAGLKGVKVAAFDTRIPMTDKVPPILRFLVKFFGYAAQPIADRLKKSGGNLVLPPEGFFVTGTEGPL